MFLSYFLRWWQVTCGNKYNSDVSGKNNGKDWICFCAKENKPTEVFQSLFFGRHALSPEPSESERDFFHQPKSRDSTVFTSSFTPAPLPLLDSNFQGKQNSPDQCIFLGPFSEQLLPTGDHYIAYMYLLSVWFLVLPFLVFSLSISFPSFNPPYNHFHTVFDIKLHVHSVNQSLGLLAKSKHSSIS